MQGRRATRRHVGGQRLGRDVESAPLIPELAVSDVLRFVAVDLIRESQARCRHDRARDDRREQDGVDEQMPGRWPPAGDRREPALDRPANQGVDAGKHEEQRAAEPPPSKVVEEVGQRGRSFARTGDGGCESKGHEAGECQGREPAASARRAAWSVPDRRARYVTATNRPTRRDECRRADRRQTLAARPGVEVLEATVTLVTQGHERPERRQTEAHTRDACGREPAHGVGIL